MIKFQMLNAVLNNTILRQQVGKIFVVFIGFILFPWVTCNKVKISIKDMKPYSRFYQKHYILPPRWLSKIFRLKNVSIPWFCLCLLYVALIGFALAPICFIISLINANVTTLIFKVYIIFLGVCNIAWAILTLIFEKKR